jgi:hypothetical protein
MKPSILIETIKKEQDDFFFNNIQIRNHKEGKLILVKYDSENSLRNVIEKYDNDKENLYKELNIFFEKRNNFIEFMVKYL